MQAPIEVTERSGEVFLLDILSHRMSEIAIFQQLAESLTWISLLLRPLSSQLV